MSSLFQLLSTDFSTLSESEIETTIDQLGHKLLNETVLHIGDVKHRLNEVEFYLRQDNHDDEFAHCDELQKSHKRWYFHKNGNTYKAGSFKGLDITFSSSGYGGILIRGIEQIEKVKVIDGPSLVVDHILSLCDSSSIKNFVDNFDLSVEGKSKLYLTESTIERREIFKCGRVGLTLKKHSPNKVKFINKFYRYLSTPKTTKKGKPYLISAMFEQGYTIDDIIKITGSPKKTVESYIKLYDEGKEKSIEEFFGATLSSQQICSLFGCASQCGV